MGSIQLFFVEFGAVDPLEFRHAIEELPLGAVDVSHQIGSQVGEYEPVREGLTRALDLLFQGVTVCLSVIPHESEIKWMLLSSPRALDSDIPMWHGMFELRSQSHETILSGLKTSKLKYVAVAKEEPFNLQEGNLNPEHFPWGSESFVAAVLVDDQGNIMERSREDS